MLDFIFPNFPAHRVYCGHWDINWDKTALTTCFRPVIHVIPPLSW